ncbi:cyclase family protein [Candidatus Pacearchaeota archaeon]|nr:cyclase family protein [Candidatus Pacearchaeota archaeon]
MIIDLTYPTYEGMFKYPSDPDPEIEINPAKIEQDPKTNDKKYKSGHTLLKIRNHHATHMDAPAHKIQGGKTIDQYDITKFVNKASLVTLAQTGPSNLLKRQKREIRVEDIKDSIDNNDNNEIKALLFYTGFCDEMRKHDGKLFKDSRHMFETKFPYFSMDAAEYIVKAFPNLNIVGIDSFALDPSGSNSEVHRTFFRNDTLALETLANLNELKLALKAKDKDTFTLHTAPILYKGADAAQVRAYAVIE